jgi:hypothetical protein
MSNFHAISLQVKSYSYFPKLNDEVCIKDNESMRPNKVTPMIWDLSDISGKLILFYVNAL